MKIFMNLIEDRNVINNDEDNVADNVDDNLMTCLQCSETFNTLIMLNTTVIYLF